MDSATELNGRYASYEQVSFRQQGPDVVVAEVDNALAVASFSLYGGHVVTWRPKHQSNPVLWVSKLAEFKPGKAIRGGVWPATLKNGHLVRFSVGLEAVEDLQADLAQAMLTALR